MTPRTNAILFGGSLLLVILVGCVVLYAPDNSDGNIEEYASPSNRKKVAYVGTSPVVRPQLKRTKEHSPAPTTPLTKEAVKALMHSGNLFDQKSCRLKESAMASLGFSIEQLDLINTELIRLAEEMASFDEKCLEMCPVGSEFDFIYKWPEGERGPDLERMKTNLAAVIPSHIIEGIHDSVRSSFPFRVWPSDTGVKLIQDTSGYQFIMGDVSASKSLDGKNNVISMQMPFPNKDRPSVAAGLFELSNWDVKNAPERWTALIALSEHINGTHQ